MDDDAADEAIERHYDALAGVWHEFTTGPTREHILWPAVRDLLPPLEGKRVLDAGCGNGDYAARLADAGASVLGVDASERMVTVARNRDGEREDLSFRRGNLNEGLESLAADSFDLVCCLHVCSHLPDLDVAISAFARVLRPGGALVVSTHHPFHDFLAVRDREYPDTDDALGWELDPVVVPAVDDPVYRDTERFEIRWAGPDSENPGVYYRRSLETLLEPLFDAGFEVRDLVEPAPDETFEREFPVLAAELRGRPPRSLCLRARLENE